MQLRPYQQESVDAVYNYLREHDDNPCVVLPTGTGKSVVLGKIAGDAVKLWDGRVLILAHVKELLEQNANKVKSLYPEIPVGVYSAGLNSRDTSEPVLVAGIQSVYNKADQLGRFDIIIVDECHLIAPEGEGMYRTFINDMKLINPHIRVIGLTATPFRMKGGLICQPENILNEVCYEAGLKEMIQQGYLSPLVSRAGRAQADLGTLHVRGGEFLNAEIEAAMDRDEITTAACKEIVTLTRDRKSVLIFTTSIAHCKHVCEAIEKFSGEECAMVSGDTPDTERAVTLERFKGKSFAIDLLGTMGKPLKYLANVSVLTTGFDAPNVDCVVLLRPTASPGLLLQMVGRGTRLSPQTGKNNCIAEGTMILTDKGLVPIEKVTTQMKLWDGVEFVPHDGIIYKGEQNVIEYAGLIATPDHKVWSEHHWRMHGECAASGSPISCTGIGGMPIREADNCFKYGSCFGRASDIKETSSVNEETKICTNVVSVRNFGMEKSGQPQKRTVWMQDLWQSTTRTKMVDSQSWSGEGQVRKSTKSTLCRLWGAWNSILFRWTNRHGSLAHGAFRLHRQADADRQNKQRWELCARKFENDNAEHQCNEYKTSNKNKNVSFQTEASGSAICGFNALPYDIKRIQRCGDYKKIQHTVKQTKRRVWDILNAGPRHRFTANGLLVSNCLILDYGENILRHGPVDCIKVKDKTPGKGGSAPAKKCPKCRALIHAGYAICPECEFVFPPPQSTNMSNTAAGEAILSGQASYTDLDVGGVFYSVHRKKGSDDSVPATMRVDYEIGFKQYQSEWVCPGHSGYARTKFLKWWKERAAIGCQIPKNAAEAVELADQGLLAEPTRIRIKKIAGEKFCTIDQYTLKERPVMREPGEDVEEYHSNSPQDLGVHKDGFDVDDDIPF